MAKAKPATTKPKSAKTTPAHEDLAVEQEVRDILKSSPAENVIHLGWSHVAAFVLGAVLGIGGSYLPSVIPNLPVISNGTPQPGAWVLLIEETGDRSPAVAKIANDLKYWDSLQSRGLKHRFYDVSSDLGRQYAEVVKTAGKSLPAILITSKDGDLLRVESVTEKSNIESIDSTVKGATKL